RDSLFDLLKALENKIDRERRSELEQRAKGLTTWLVAHIRVSRQSYSVVETLARDRAALSLPLEASASIPPLARVVLESLFSIAFVLEQPAVRLSWFWKATWAKLRDELRDLTSEYGTVPKWMDWLKTLEEQRDSWRQLLAQNGTPLSP